MAIKKMSENQKDKVSGGARGFVQMTNLKCEKCGKILSWGGDYSKYRGPCPNGCGNTMVPEEIIDKYGIKWTQEEFNDPLGTNK